MQHEYYLIFSKFADYDIVSFTAINTTNNAMKRILTIIAAAAVIAGCKSKATVPEGGISIVPNPVSVEYAGNGVVIDPKTGRPEVEQKIDSTLASEEYILDATGSKVVITAGSETGLWWGEQTLRQILAQVDGSIPGILIKDKPAFAYRGAHFDCCRHFFPIEDVKSFIDMANMHKLNVFHWHLTDDQGWRAEIKAFPELTKVGAYRGESNYGGYYTQDEMREIVAYAAERHMTVIPEIEMPGHASAALASYPSLGCRGKGYKVLEEWGIFEDVFCIGKEETFDFLEKVLDEICEIFPGKYIHIGGDECPRTNWKKCPYCQKRMKEEGLKSEAELQSYLLRRIEKYLNDKGRSIIGWDEILEGGVTKTATVMSWRGAKGGIEAAKLGNDVVMSPYTHFYLDYYQTSQPAKYEPEGTPYPTYLPLRKCYEFNPFDQLDEEQSAHIVGIQANTWCEYIPNLSHAQHMFLPRGAAMAEIAWSFNNRTDYDTFVERCRKALLPLYEKKGYNYADYAFRVPAVE